LAGHPGDAFRLQPLVVLCAALAGPICGAYAWVLLLRKRVAHVRLEPAERTILWIALAVLAALNWLYLVRCGV
jgi:hypothetical protein